MMDLVLTEGLIKVVEVDLSSGHVPSQSHNLKMRNLLKRLGHLIHMLDLSVNSFFCFLYVLL